MQEGAATTAASAGPSAPPRPRDRAAAGGAGGRAGCAACGAWTPVLRPPAAAARQSAAARQPRAVLLARLADRYRPTLRSSAAAPPPLARPALPRGVEPGMLQRTSPRPPPGCGDDAASEASSDAPEDADLPQCKIRRNYNCAKCTFFTQNPRQYLAHVRDAHDERIKIYECPQCVYASRHHQKLLRHIKMIHATGPRGEEPPAAPPPPPVADDVAEEADETSRDADDAEADVDDETPAAPPGGRDDSRSLGCAQCDFVAGERAELSKHERSAHARPNFFSCGKCNYVTHIKARFTKHVKYHSMPMIKCTLCDFRTPYKWNLDRHMKNHGGGGAFCCSMCSFTADIKQSLTVHEMNHHTPPRGRGRAGGGAVRRRNKVGASDLLAAAATATATADAEEAMLVKDEGSTDSQSDSGSYHCNTSDMASLNNESNDVASAEACLDEVGMNSSDAHQSFQNVCSALESLRQSRKLPRPIPRLIPLNSSTPTQTSSRSSSAEPPLKRFKDMFSGNVDLDILNYSTTDIFKVDRLPEEMPPRLAGSPATPASGAPRKKNETFFDKLKERLLTETGASGTLTCKNCGFESKCLSEHSVHEKNCASPAKSVIPNAAMPSLGSTRCQNCRHRCKSSADLYVHMQTCRAVVAAAAVAPEPDESEQPHPMENVVFVWNTMSSEPECPLEVSVADEAPGAYDPNNVDALHDTETSSLSPTQVAGKRVFKCPHCPFWASTASRFHVHIVGHLNKKPFECSLCNYKSNWRWDITKHIRLKSVRDAAHNDAKVLMTDETGRRNYSKYSKYLAALTPSQQTKAANQALQKKQMQDAAVNVDEPDILSASSNENPIAPALTIMPLNLQITNRSNDANEGHVKKPKKTLWKCKKCNYRNPSKEALLEHVRGHTKPENFETEDSSTMAPHQKKHDPNSKEPESPALAYQCGHCNQLSNWKHVIQRHCRLKHNGVIKVISVERPKQDPQELTLNDISTDYCQKCPFKTNDKKLLFSHMQQHMPSPLSIFKCYFCPYFVKNQADLMEHLPLHGISDPEDYVAKAMGCKSPLPEPVAGIKRHKCTECPYETNSKSQFMYHEQFHRLPPNTPYKCQICNYSVTKRHLLHQHMKVHGGGGARKDSTHEVDAYPADFSRLPAVTITAIPANSDDNPDEIPYVWVSAKNEFHKMYKCRYCSYVNSQQCKIPNHEKIHIIWYDNDKTVYKCLECKYTCDSAARLTEHSKFHGEIYGRIYYPVDPNLSDEEQIGKLRLLLEDEKQALMESFKKEDLSDRESEIEKISDAGKNLHFCKKCPARFLAESECSIHSRFHELKFPIQCKICTYTIPQESQMAAHTFVHTDDYQAKTKMLQMMHETHPGYPQPKVVSIKYSTSEDLIWVVVDENVAECNMNDLPQPSTSSTAIKCEPPTKPANKQYSCEHCPATFFKSSALNYHLSLHGAEGGHKCKKCDYTVKNIGNLAKHELVHEKDDSSLTNEYKADFDSGDDMDFKNVPLSGTDLFQHKTEAQKRVRKEKLIMRPNDHFPPVLQADPQFGYLMHGNPEFIYPTYLKNGRQKEKRYKCHKCPSAFEKREQYKVHLSLHGSKQRYKCELCDYSVKYYANYVQHMRKHQMNAEAHAERNKGSDGECSKPQPIDAAEENDVGNIKLAIKTIPKYTAKSDFMQFSIGDQQTLRLLQRRRSSVGSGQDAAPTEPSTEKEKKWHACMYCPYTNQRRDALEIHHRRHKGFSSKYVSKYECSHCDFTCNQSHFLREHLKSHFNPHKNAAPQCYVHNQDVVLTITKLVDEADGEVSEIRFSPLEDGKEAHSKVGDRIFVQPATGEIIVV